MSLRVAIIGGGISGLCLASILAKYDADKKLAIMVYEAAQSFGEVGAGVTLWGRSKYVTRALGIDDTLSNLDMNRNANTKDWAFIYRRSDQGPSGHEFARRPFVNGSSFHRAQFLNVFSDLVEASPSIGVQFRKRLASVARTIRNSEYQLSFKDGSSATCDVIVGADGIRSSVREAMLNFAAEDLADRSLLSGARAVWTGDVIYRVLIPTEEYKDMYARHGGEGEPIATTGPILFVGKAKGFATYPIQNGKMLNVALSMMNPSNYGEEYPEENWISEVDSRFLFEEFKGWELEVDALVEGMVTRKANRWAIHVVPGLKFFSHDRIAIQGDAAHAMTPYNGSGVNQAIEDAFILGRMLTHPLVTRETVPQALRAYDSVRRERAQAVQELSLLLGRMAALSADLGLGADADDDTLEAAIAERTVSAGAWVGEGDLEADFQRAGQNFIRFTSESGM